MCFHYDCDKYITIILSQITFLKHYFIASVDDKINLPESEAHTFASQPLVSCGDTLFLLNGKKIICQVMEITEESIKYKQYDNIDGSIYSTAKKEASKIVYINGKSELMIVATSKDIANNTSSNNQSNACNDTLIFKDGKILICEILEVKSDYIKYKKCDSLNKAEYYIERNKVKRFVNSAAIEPELLENYSTPKKQKKREVSPFSLLGFVSSLVSCILILLTIWTEAIVVAILPFLLGILFGAIGLLQIYFNRERYNGTTLSVLALILPLITYFGFIYLLFLFGF